MYKFLFSFLFCLLNNCLFCVVFLCVFFFLGGGGGAHTRLSVTKEMKSKRDLCCCNWRLPLVCLADRRSDLWLWTALQQDAQPVPSL